MNVFCLLLCHIKLPERILTWNLFFYLFWSWLVLMEKKFTLLILLAEKEVCFSLPSVQWCLPSVQWFGCCSTNILAFAYNIFFRKCASWSGYQRDPSTVRSLAQEHTETYIGNKDTSLHYKCSYICWELVGIFTYHFQNIPGNSFSD